MSAGIKQRMAGILAGHQLTGAAYCRCMCGWVAESLIPHVSWRDQYAEHVADSIVESLALKREDDGDSYRYSTDWES